MIATDEPGGAAPDARTFEIIPAIDLRGGRVVRLLEGDFDRETVYSEEPVAVARAFEEAGATRLHVVDLDGAVAGRPVQAALVGSVVEAVTIPVQQAGGLRDAAAVARAFQMGADRVVLGSALLADPDFAARLAARYGRRLVAAVDVRHGSAVGEGWRRGAPERPLRDAVRDLVDAGVTVFAVTAVARDGGLEGPDTALLKQVIAWAPGTQVIASAGISGAADLRAVRDLGCSGAILGRALYEGRLSLREAMAAARGQQRVTSADSPGPPLEEPFGGGVAPDEPGPVRGNIPDRERPHPAP